MMQNTFLLISILFSLNVQANECVDTESSFQCVKYIKNYDGDTLTVSIPKAHPLFGKEVSVRVRGIDTPEIKGKQPCEKETARIAKKLVEATLKNAKRIDLENVGRDKYFRILADVKADNQNLKDLLLKNNLAYPYEGATKLKKDWCRSPASVKK